MKKKVYCKDCEYYAPLDPLYYAYYTPGAHFPIDCSETHSIRGDTPIEVVYHRDCHTKNADNRCKWYKVDKKTERDSP